MTACKPAPAAKKSDPAKHVQRAKSPARRGERFRETDEDRAFEAVIRWFLAVSRAA